MTVHLPDPSPLDPALVAQVREQFLTTRHGIYLNHAAVAPISTAGRDAVTAWLDDLARHGLANEEKWETMGERARGLAARLLQARPDEVAFVRNTSHGLSLVAEGLPWEPGDQVAVALSQEYPSNIYPWQHLAHRGVHVVPISTARSGVTVAEVEACLTERTRLVALSSAQYASGAVADLTAIGAALNKRGIWFCVDGIQTVGAIPLDVHAAGIHFLAADSHKWQLGMPGLGILFAAQPLVQRIRPALVGWKSMVDGWNFDAASFELLPDARRFEEGSPPYALMAGYEQAIGMLLEVGIERICGHLRHLVARLAARLSALGCELGPAPGMQVHILTFGLPHGDPGQLTTFLLEHGITVSLRRGRIRVSPHLYNTEQEMDRVADRVEEFLGR